MNTSLWILGFIIVMALTLAQTRPRPRRQKETPMEKIDCTQVLRRLRPPLLSFKRAGYRPHVNAWVAQLDMVELKALCRFFECDVSHVVTRIMDWQYARAREEHQLRRAQRRGIKAPAPPKS
jgi:hypothetical protein